MVKIIMEDQTGGITMKHWMINYAVKYVDGRTEEKRAIVEGRYMVTALGTALLDIIDPLLEREDVRDAVIWSIVINDVDVFPEEGDLNDH